MVSKPKALTNSIIGNTSIASQQSQVTLQPSKIELPEYPDRGVRWDKYAKELISGSKYKLIPMGCYCYGFQIAVAAGAQIMPIVNAQTQITYLTDMEFQFYGATAGDLFIFEIPAEQAFKPVQLVIMMQAATGVYKYEFKAPLRITKTVGISGMPEISITSTNGAVITYNFIGFYEEQ